MGGSSDADGMRVEVETVTKRRRYSRWGARVGSGPMGRTARAGGAILAVVAGLTILLAFTPLYFFLARPLVRTDPLQKTQAIVVVSGGLRHDTSLGTSTSERVSYGVELAKRGYAPLLVMSGGGPVRSVTDAEVMAREAVRLGIAREVVLIEDQSESTWENAVLTAKLLRDRKVNEILLVTCPYHSLRAKLMFRARGLAVAVAPVPDSEFARARGLDRLRFLRLILLEYVKLVFFWMSRL
jgi:uncharacterized SAM-binding protein YcdF (DUF218 family)